MERGLGRKKSGCPTRGLKDSKVGMGKGEEAKTTKRARGGTLGEDSRLEGERFWSLLGTISQGFVHKSGGGKG